MDLSPHPKKRDFCLVTIDTLAESKVIHDMYVNPHIRSIGRLGWRAGFLREEELPKTVTVHHKAIAGAAAYLEGESQMLYRRTGGWESLPPDQDAVRLALLGYIEQVKQARAEELVELAAHQAESERQGAE